MSKGTTPHSQTLVAQFAKDEDVIILEATVSYGKVYFLSLCYLMCIFTTIKIELYSLFQEMSLLHQR